MFKKILIANRGEIAMRVINTCKDMGIKTVAVYSDADVKALHVIEADQAVHIGPSEPVLSYLNIDNIIRAAKKTDAEAIHPGYGFLSENFEFAGKCEKENIVFIGPPSQVIKDMGDKITSRKIMIDGKVPVTPGLNTKKASIDEMCRQADKIGYPVLIKASAGGGGKGIRIVNSAKDMKKACAAASSEAQNAFGNNEIYLEKFFVKARHIEFQILADMHGNVVHLFERECSIQRRHQKIIEETPSLVLTPELRDKMGSVAIAAAKAAKYVNAGTVEFLVDPDNNYYFLEMNTRLQVEHPITEMTTGIDLVRHQLEIAFGNKLSLAQENIKPRGHAIECRVYAEDPENNFFPSPGKIQYIKEPKGPGIRNDCGVYAGFQVPVEYDPILSKLVVYSESRDKCIKKCVQALKEYIILGVTTPITLLIDILNSDPFISGKVFTDFIEDHFSDWEPENKKNDADIAGIAFIVDEFCNKRKFKSNAHGESEVTTPFQTLGNWKL